MLVTDLLISRKKLKRKHCEGSLEERI